MTKEVTQLWNPDIGGNLSGQLALAMGLDPERVMWVVVCGKWNLEERHFWAHVEGKITTAQNRAFWKEFYAHVQGMASVGISDESNREAWLTSRRPVVVAGDYRGLAQLTVTR